MPTVIAAAILLLLASAAAFGHGAASTGDGDTERYIEFPDTAEHVVMTFDPHTHSVFSDGHVWPRTRIAEALRDGLDAIAITEHLEYQPHLRDIPHPDRNRAWEIAAEAAAGTELIVVAGSELTRRAPAGHMNAIFIDDANALIRGPLGEVMTPDDFYDAAREWPAQEAVEAANDQGAFVFWNHAYWTRDFPNGIARIPDFHVQNARRGLLHGIEIANGQSYSEETFQIALDHNLTLIGVSDVHNLIDWDYKPHEGGHRPVTLVLADARTEAAMKAALFDRRTVVWFQNMLMGRADHLGPLLDASLSISSASYGQGEILGVGITNVSDASFELKNLSGYTFYRHTDFVTVPPHSTIEIAVKTPTKQTGIDLRFEVLNALTAPKQNAIMTLSTSID